MSIQSFYEYVILRDILAFVLPGGISLAGIYMIVYAIGDDRWKKTLPFISDSFFININPFLAGLLLIMISYLIGHIWDMLYRKKFQTNIAFQRNETIKKLLLGDQVAGIKSVENHIANEIRRSVGEFLNINWKNTPLLPWIESGKAYQASLLLAYWIEEEDPKLFGTEIGRPIVQSHLLHVCGMAFYFFSSCVSISGAIGGIPYWTGSSSFLAFDPWVLGLLIFFPFWFGKMLIEQGTHKRDVIMEHVFRVFYVIWRKRILGQKSRAEKNIRRLSI